LYKPVTNGRITSEYGWRISPFDKNKKEWHPGIDIAPPKDGSDPHPNIYNVWKSQVVEMGTSSSFGERVWVKLLDGPHKDLLMVYPHMLKINSELHKNMILQEGFLIGLMGNTGLSKGIHTHLEIRPSTAPGNAINPVEIRELY
jgi:murein DD-endopeptidase MepM/ murein hydrolase activator NlpD